MIVAEDLTKRFDHFLAVDGVSLSVPAGTVLGLLGPNGAGKTTTVRMLISVLRPTRGWAKVAGYDVVRQPDRVRASVGVLTEHHSLYARMKSVEYLEFYGQLYRIDRQVIRRRIDNLLEQFGLGDARDKRLGEYSKGMRQKLALVRAMLHDPPVLLLDEPTSAMDPESARTVRDSIHRLRSADRAIILCTHNLDEANELADQVAFIRRGRIILAGDKSDLKHRILGEPEYEARFEAGPEPGLDGLPAFARLISKGENCLRFCVDDPGKNNPELLRWLLGRGLNIKTFQEISQPLEEVYMRAMQQADGDDRNQ